MVLFPCIGGAYWYVTDFYEAFYAIPVTVAGRSEAPAPFVLEFKLLPDEESDEGETAGTYNASRRELYRTQRRAARRAGRLNREAGKE